MLPISHGCPKLVLEILLLSLYLNFRSESGVILATNINVYWKYDGENGKRALAKEEQQLNKSYIKKGILSKILEDMIPILLT